MIDNRDIDEHRAWLAQHAPDWLSAFDAGASFAFIEANIKLELLHEQGVKHLLHLYKEGIIS